MKRLQAQFSSILLLAWLLASRLAKSKGRLVVSADNVALVTRCFTTSGKKENKRNRMCCLRTGKTRNLGSIQKEDTYTGESKL